MEVVKRSLEGKPIPPDTPPNHTYVPHKVRSVVLEWAHSSSFACRPGVRLALLYHRFWWKSVRRDTEEFVASCLVCARSKTNSQQPQGLLQPLPVPHRPHIAIDFVTGLPESQGHSVILTIVDRFSVCSLCTPYQITFLQRNSTDPDSTCLPSPWTPPRGHFGQRSSVFQCILERLLHFSWRKTPIVIWIPSSDQRPNGETQSRTGEVSPLPGGGFSQFLGHFITLDWIRL